MPGMKKLQKPLVKTAENLWPIAKEYPDVLEKILPTLKEITKEDNPTEKQYSKWGKSLYKIVGPYISKKRKAVKASPIAELITKLKAFKVDLKAADLLDGEALEHLQDFNSWFHRMVQLSVDLDGDENNDKARKKRKKRMRRM